MNLYKRSVKTLSMIFLLYASLLLVFIIGKYSDYNFLIFFFLITIITLIVLILYLRTIIKPIEKIDEQLEKVSKNNYDIKFFDRPQVYKKIMRNIENIASLLHKYETKLSKNKEGFYLIIDSIQEAIWIQDKKGVITTSNEAFQKLVGQNNVKDIYFWHAIREQNLYNFVDELFKKPKNKIKEFDLYDKHFICSASYSNLTGEIIFILHDITEIKNLEILKKDLILNVSHELRTPLTSIKGYLETLELEIDKKNKSYIEVITRNTDRLINIVKDLLSLSKLEHDSSIEIEKIEINPFLNHLKKIFQIKLKKKRLELKYILEDEIAYLEADQFKLEQVFINLLDNAINYTENGFIQISFQKQDNDTKIVIQDTGIGIPKEHLPRIFDRFYVVDKSRSRKHGSTGLGLSIVKHIVNLHEGKIDVKSEPGEGTSFTILIPNKIIKQNG